MERPQNRHLKPFKPKGEKALGGRICVRVDEEIERAVRSMPDAPEWLRRVIVGALQGQGDVSRDVLLRLRELLVQGLEQRDMVPLQEAVQEAVALIDQHLEKPVQSAFPGMLATGASGGQSGNVSESG